LWAESLHDVGLLDANRGFTYSGYIGEHPFSLPARELIAWFDQHAPDIAISQSFNVIQSPGHRGHAQPSPLAEAYGVPPAPEPQELNRWSVPSVILNDSDLVTTWFKFPPEGTGGMIYGEDLAFWMQVAYRLLVVLRDQRYLPQMIDTYYRTYYTQWVWWDDAHKFQALMKAMPMSAVSFRHTLDTYTELDQTFASVLDMMIDNFIRRNAKSKDHKYLVSGNSGALPRGDYQHIERIRKAWGQWQDNLPPLPPPFHLVLRLDEPEHDDAPWRITFLLQSAHEASLIIEAQNIWEAGPAYDQLEAVIQHPRIFFMRQVARATDYSPLLNIQVNQRRLSHVLLNANEAYHFLIEDAVALEAAGFPVLVPDWWERQRKLKLRSQLQNVDESLGLLNKDTLFNYQWQVALGDDIELSREEFEQLVNLKQPLVQHQGQWVALDEKQIAAAKAFFEQQRTQEGTVGLFDALHASAEAKAAANEIDDDALIQIEPPQVSAEVEKAFKRLRKQQQRKQVTPPNGLNATLRPYQLKGYQWLVTMREMGLGACLADDMGLGKTIQAIALWLYERERLKVSGPALLVCPTSVVGNWQHELEQFGPSLRVLAHHGAGRPDADAFPEAVQDVDIVLTSYALLPRDRDQLTAIEWDSVTLDEAQNIKNPVTKQAQVTRALKANFRLALTGTPIENRLSELWSLFRFLNPGYLGSRKSFQSRFATPIEKRNDPQAAQTLRQLVAPFILRRVKTDPKVIQDLPDKFENRIFCNLTTEQASLYEAIVRTELENIAQADNQMARRGAVLRMLVHLKQVCNHPAQYLKQKEIQPRASGKLQRLTEMLTAVRENGERALIFTQYARMGHLLQAYIADLLGESVLFLHGGTPGVKRAAMVEEFQQEDGPPVFVLSLKAGGTGLNLTAATQVFHYDRWYNPAVEDQATDRAYRIGQRQVVQVHKFIAIGTLEERIDALLTRKREIADQVIGSGEGWISEMSDAELRDLVTLRAEAVR